MASSDNTTGSSHLLVESEDEKSHSFRRRRLSLSRRNSAPETGQDSSDIKNGGNHHGEASDLPPLPLVMAPSVLIEGGAASTNKRSHSDANAQNDDESTAAESTPSDKKAHTFRKRRLSLNSMSHPCASAGEKHDAACMEEASPVGKVPHKDDASTSMSQSQQQRPRRYSDASLSSLRSNQSGEDVVLRVRTIHAGEILGQSSDSPPSPSITNAGVLQSSVGEGKLGLSGRAESRHQQPHVLYRQSRPSSTSLLHDAREGNVHSNSRPQPKWKKLIVRKDDDDERKLPFPRDVVGTYSCHGVEPVYDTHYDDIDALGDSNIDKVGSCSSGDVCDWSEDISGASTSLASPGNERKHFALTTQANTSEPRPTTAAKINQDRGGVAFPYGNCPKTALFAAYDGHGQGGELVSQYALHEIQSRLEKRPEFQSNLARALIETFLAVDGDLQNEPIIEPLYAGTTACVALLRDNVITCANAGDSRAVVARRKQSPGCSVDVGLHDAIDLTVDQNPDLPAERQRIESMGGFVSPPPEPGLSARVWLDEGYSQIGLAMARSIGDHAVARVGVISTPVVSTHTLIEEDEFLIIATDGVWEFVSSQDAVAIVGANLSQGATKATQALIEAAAARWHDEEGDYRDDITALVIHLAELWKDRSKASSK